ncbi:MAG: hypothetical protein KAT43_04210 [Nanoarchaeota archaeon]|nr:hypothetical protein [Nanoarchaeota archaeon]
MAKKKAVKTAPITKEGEVFFVGIKDPIEIKRDLLESTKDSITIIKTYENIKSLRIEKVKQMLVLQKLIKELNALTNKLKRALPETRVREKPKISSRALKKEEPSRKLTEFEKLEVELSSIEEKLSHL